MLIISNIVGEGFLNIKQIIIVEIEDGIVGIHKYFTESQEWRYFVKVQQEQKRVED